MRKIATFRGRHNAEKSKILIVLYFRLVKQGINGGLGIMELHKLSGVSTSYLRCKLGRLSAWGYLRRKTGTNPHGRPVFVYTIARRGEHFVEDVLPENILNQYVAEIKAFRSKQANLFMKNENLSGN